MFKLTKMVLVFVNSFSHYGYNFHSEAAFENGERVPSYPTLKTFSNQDVEDTIARNLIGIPDYTVLEIILPKGYEFLDKELEKQVTNLVQYR